MNPDKLIPGKEYIIKGIESYHPVGFGTERRYKSYSNKGKFLGEYVVGEDKTMLLFDNFQIEVRYSIPKQSKILKMRLNGDTTIDRIIEANKTE